jgi:hypothetical protein
MRLVTVLALAALAPLPAGADSGAIDWGARVVRCTGSGAANLRDAGGNPAVARIGAEKAAKLDALRNCLEALRGVQLDSGRTVGSALDSDTALAGRVQGLVRGFKPVGKPRYYDDGGVELDVEVPLDGKLSDALLRDAAEARPALSAAGGAAPGTSLVRDGTSLVIDGRGLKVIPALAPRVVSFSGRELYGPALLGATARQAGGAAAYARDLESARRDLAARLGDRPLVVKAVRADGADLVVSDVDAARLTGDLGFLAEGRVVFLAD